MVVLGRWLVPNRPVPRLIHLENIGASQQRPTREQSQLTPVFMLRNTMSLADISLFQA